MDINEIKIGDWFEFSEGRGQISLIYGDTVTINTYQPDIAELKPIPLTKEILEKNGWIYRKDKLRWDGWKKNSLLLVQKKLHNTFTVFIENLADSIEFHNINYVHELQHLLWTLGLDDNLKA